MPSSSRVRRRPRLDAPTLDRLVAALPLTQAVGRVRVQALAAGAELHLVGTIGEEITAAGVLAALQGIGGDVPLTARINSPGGSVFEGFAIYNALARRPGTSTVFIEGVAASIASLIAMAGAEIVMPGNAFLMLHNPSGLALGTSIDMRGLADLLDRLAGAMVAIYAQRSGQTPETVQQLMDAETWLDAPGAMELGFADRVEAPATVAACFDLSRFKNTPRAAPRAVTFPRRRCRRRFPRRRRRLPPILRRNIPPCH